MYIVDPNSTTNTVTITIARKSRDTVCIYSRGQKKVNTSFSCNGAFYRLCFVFVSFPFSVPTPRSTDGRPVNGVLE